MKTQEATMQVLNGFIFGFGFYIGVVIAFLIMNAIGIPTPVR